MSVYLVDVEYVTHTCPCNPSPHVIDTTQTVVEHRASGSCRHPQTVRSGMTTATVDCRLVLRTDRQCEHCRVEVEIRHERTRHIGPARRGSCGAPDGLAAYPCRICGRPLAAILTDLGVHLLCVPRGGRP